jgi:catechol 2,3-dioxygenase-like lactoylglutathione lyase family enzyme
MVEQGEEAMTKPILSSVAAQLFVADIKASCNFYTEKLRFSVAFVWGEPPFYAQVRRDNARLNLRCIGEAVVDPALRERESLLSADIGVDTPGEIEQLFIELKAAGIEFHQALQRQPWGARNFIVRDPDGNLILFAGPAE